MAASEVQLCNRALARIGQTSLIEEVHPAIADVAAELADEITEQAALLYGPARDTVLRRVDWPFARVRVALAELPGETRDSWEYVYAAPAPSSCLAIRYVVPEGIRTPRPDQVVPHAVEARVDAGTGDVVGKLILCDQEDAVLVYTTRVTNAAVFDPDFERALILLLAADLARAIVKGLEGARLADDLEQRYELVVRRAAAAALNEQVEDPDPTASFEASRS